MPKYNPIDVCIWLLEKKDVKTLKQVILKSHTTIPMRLILAAIELQNNQALDFILKIRKASQPDTPLEEIICTEIARTGSLQLMKTARDNGCPMNSEPLIEAASTGNLPLFKYLIMADCPWSNMAIYTACMNGQQGILKWILTKESIIVPPEAYDYAIINNQYEIMQLLDNSGIIFSENAMLNACAVDPIFFVFLYERNAKFDMTECKRVAQEQSNWLVLHFLKLIEKNQWNLSTVKQLLVLNTK